MLLSEFCDELRVGMIRRQKPKGCRYFFFLLQEDLPFWNPLSTHARFL